MNNEKQRLVLIVILMLGWMLLINRLGLVPKPRKKVPDLIAKQEPEKGKEAKANDKTAQQPKLAETKASEAAKKPEAEKNRPGKPEAEKPKTPKVEVVAENELVLGSVTDKTPEGYRLEVQLCQNGAGIESVLSSRYDAEFEGRKNPHKPLHLIGRDPVHPPSMSLTLSSTPSGPAQTAEAGDGGDAEEGPRKVPETEDFLDSVLWEAVRDSNGKIVHPITAVDPETDARIQGQEAVFRTTADNGVIVTKTFRLRPGADGMEVDLKFESPDKERVFSYHLLGPHGIPIKDDSYTGTFREVYFGTYDGSIKIDTHTAYDIAKGKTIDSTALPLRFTGVENQYFAIFMAPYPAPNGQDDRIDSKTVAVLLRKDESSLAKSDVGIRLTSKPLKVGPNSPAFHTYRVFLGPKTPEALSGEGAAAALTVFHGPKTPEALAAYDATGLAAYRKSSIIPGASAVARYIITPALGFTYDLTTWVSRLFGGKTGNWGVAIILMTLLVKLIMFPLGRKQALMAQRMQELQPYMKEIQEKYKDEKDKEKQTRETFALYKKHKVNPVSGCIPALIQLPIFVGLWQALSSSVSLRHSPFLWINDLASPDMLFRIPFDIPLLTAWLGHWFNVLPIVVVALMLFQTKLFSPPPTTPEAEMQQKTMKYMMIFMAAMFYKVPSGLGLYFITSSLWSIGERLLLPKVSHAAPAKKTEEEIETGGRRGRGGPGGRAPGGNGAAPAKKAPSALAQFWEKVLEDARKNPTYRKMLDDKEGKSSADDRRDRDKPRARPGRK
ncbi:MAG: membrane protein insertase YidC [Isosphaeraceae bacterium]